MWWLRSPGYYSYNAAEVSNDGWVYRYGNYVSYYIGGVRPALHLNLSSSNLYSYAGTVCSDVMKSGESGSDNPVNPGKPEGETTTTPTKVTEDMLFTPEYCKYLNNTTYNKMFETLWTDMSDVSRNCKWDDISIAARTVMSDGISGQLKRIGESLVSKAFNKNIQAEKVQSALA